MCVWWRIHPDPSNALPCCCDAFQHFPTIVVDKSPKEMVTSSRLSVAAAFRLIQSKPRALAAAEANALQARDGLRVLWVWRPSGSYEAAKKELEKSLQEKEEAGSHRDLNLTNSKAGWERQKRAPTQKPKSCRQEQCQNQ